MLSKLTSVESEFAQTHVHWVGDAIESVMPSHPPMTKEELWQEKAMIFVFIYCWVLYHVAFSFISP